MPGLTRTGPGLMMTGGYCHLSGAVYTQILPGAIAPLTPHPTLASGLFLNFLIRYLSCVWGQWGVGSGTYQVYQTDNYIANYIHQPTTYKCRCKGKIFMVCHIQVILLHGSLILSAQTPKIIISMLLKLYINTTCL